MYKSLLALAVVALLWGMPLGLFANPPGAAPQANTFNRLMTPKAPANLPPAEDGIHDPENTGTHELQHPKEAFAGLVESGYGNHVDWVQSLRDGELAPRANLNDPNIKPVVMNLDIVREVRGSMGDVVYPHDRHTEILACSNCHPAIFVPKKGANQISMANIMLGQTCGVCHGSVAFPINSSTCTKCHSRPKDETTALTRSHAGAE